MVKVEVTDANDNLPEFVPSDYAATVDEGFSVGAAVVTVAAADPDSGAAGTVEFSLADDANGLFEIEAATGKIALSRSIPRGHESSYVLRVDAADGLGLRALVQARVEVFVSDASAFERPQFEFRVDEDVSPYSSVGKIRTRRSVNGFGDVRFTVYGSNAGSSVGVDPRTGELRTEARLDHETTPLIVLNVLAESDGGDETFCQVLIRVNDVNDNAPEFGTSEALAFVKEDSAPGETVYSAAARDRDAGDNGRVGYGLRSDDSGGIFRVEAETGNVVLVRPLDFETRQEYELVIEASDGGSPPLKSELKLHISANDVNDNRPVFEDKLYTFNLAETLAINIPIDSVKAIDR